MLCRWLFCHFIFGTVVVSMTSPTLHIQLRYRDWSFGLIKISILFSSLMNFLVRLAVKNPRYFISKFCDLMDYKNVLSEKKYRTITYHLVKSWNFRDHTCCIVLLQSPNLSIEESNIFFTTSDTITVCRIRSNASYTIHRFNTLAYSD